MKKYYLCTRPRLAAALEKKGVPIQRTVNPFATDKAHRAAWDVELTRDAALIISHYFQDNGKPVPKSVVAFIRDDCPDFKRRAAQAKKAKATALTEQKGGVANG